MRFVCSFVWADLEVHTKERKLVHSLVTKLKLSPQEAQQVEQWLKMPPQVDPTQVPVEHREIFLNAARQVFAADGEIAEAEEDTFALLDELLR